MSDIIHELNGKKYLLVELPLTTDKDHNKKMQSCMKKFNCIAQGVKEISTGGWFSKPYVIIKILVPEENVIQFNNES